MILFVLGLFIGGLIGCLAMSFASAALNTAQYETGYFAGYRKASAGDSEALSRALPGAATRPHQTEGR